MDEIEMKNLMDELYLRIFMLEEQLNEQEDKIEELVQRLIHTHITLEEMEKIGEIIYG